MLGEARLRTTTSEPSFATVQQVRSVESPTSKWTRRPEWHHRRRTICCDLCPLLHSQHTGCWSKFSAVALAAYGRFTIPESRGRPRKSSPAGSSMVNCALLQTPVDLISISTTCAAPFTHPPRPAHQGCSWHSPVSSRIRCINKQSLGRHFNLNHRPPATSSPPPPVSHRPRPLLLSAHIPPSPIRNNNWESGPASSAPALLLFDLDRQAPRRYKESRPSSLTSAGEHTNNINTSHTTPTLAFSTRHSASMQDAAFVQ
jgi:hypothetical protein